MALIDSFEKSGNFLFRYRGHLPIILIILAIPVSLITPYQSISKFKYLEFSFHVFCFCSVLVGHLIRILTVGRRFMHSSGRNRSHQVAKELNTTGMYSIVRHPLYLGNALIWFGLVCFLENYWFVFIFILMFWLYYERIMFAEEQFLERQFGDKFKMWSLGVPAFIPNFRKFTPSNSSFSWRIFLKNEYPGWISTMTTILFLIILKRSVMMQELKLTSIDAYFALFILFFGLIFKGIKKFTNLFNPMD
jgi:protein-S-isoprenylcysteine O-methyltransferase Ste14